MKSIVLFASILRIVLIALIISFAVYANAQNVAVNTNGAAADASAMLDVASTTKGFLPPRMTTIQRTGISLPANGLMVFDTDTKSLWIFSTTWKDIGGAQNFSLPYNGSSANGGPAFYINNTANLIGSSAVAGRSGNGAGFIPTNTMGIWGDNSTGVGVAGTSNNIGIMGMSSGTDGVAILGTAGTNQSFSTAGRFINNYSANNRSVVEVDNYGVGKGIEMTNTNLSNNNSMLYMSNFGPGKFIALNDGNGIEKFSIGNSGNINTVSNIYSGGNISADGNISANGKGIIQNSSSTQLRYEVVHAAVEGLGGAELQILPGQFFDRTFSFANAFTAAPAVSLGNILPGYSINALYKLHIMVTNVTTTQCTIRITNYSTETFFFKGTWNLIAVGPK